MKAVLSMGLVSVLFSTLWVWGGVLGGWLTLNPAAGWLLHPVTLIHHHLRFSIVPFTALLVLYGYLVIDIRRMLKQQRVELFRLTYRDRLLNLTVSSFFGVGVIFTAVGIEGALFEALAGFNPTAGGPAQTPWTLLERLVNGGLVMALSTTIFGGVCGYTLRMLKLLLIGSQWDRVMLHAWREGNTDVEASSTPVAQ